MLNCRYEALLSGLVNLQRKKVTFLVGLTTQELLLYLYSNLEVIFVHFPM